LADWPAVGQTAQAEPENAAKTAVPAGSVHKKTIFAGFGAATSAARCLANGGGQPLPMEPKRQAPRFFYKVRFVLYAFFKELKVKQGIEGYGTNA